MSTIIKLFSIMVISFLIGLAAHTIVHSDTHLNEQNGVEAVSTRR